MASTNKTTNYQLSQFQSSDIPAWLTDYNGDMQKIDAGIHAAKTQADGAAGGVSALQTAVSGKQDRLTFDTTPLSGSTNPVTSGGIYNALQNVSVQTDAVPTEGSTKAVQSGGVYNALQGKQNALTFDNTPTQNSSNPVTSGGIFNAISAAALSAPQYLTVEPTVHGGISGMAVKIGKCVFVQFAGRGATGAKSYLNIPNIKVVDTPATVSYCGYKYDGTTFTPMNVDSASGASTVIYREATNSTRISLASTFTNDENVMVWGWVAFTCE